MIHIRAARLIHKIPNSFGDNDVLSKVGWMPLEYFYKLRILTITYNAYYNLGLREINCLVTKNSNSYNLRKSLNVVLNRPKTELGRRSFAHRSAAASTGFSSNFFTVFGSSSVSFPFSSLLFCLSSGSTSIFTSMLSSSLTGLRSWKIMQKCTVTCYRTPPILAPNTLQLASSEANHRWKFMAKGLR